MFESESEDDMRTIRALPLWQAFLAAVIAPIIIALVFAILGAQKNALLLQIELIVVAIAFCLTGILARSKLLGFLSIFAAPISWVVLFFASTFTGGWFVNPFGLLSELAGPLTSIAQSELVPEDSADVMKAVINVAIVIDLIILELMAFFLGFFLSTLATGIWTKKGELSILSVIFKPIAGIFTILILISVPFVYHGVANFADGGISLIAGASEFYSVFGGELEGTGTGGGGAQAGGIPIDLSDPEVLDNLTKACERAAKWFSRSAYKFDHVQGNFYTKLLLQLLPEEMSGINMQKIDKLLDFSEILALVSKEIPDLLLGFYCLTDGFDRTFTVLGESDIGGGGASIGVYDPNDYDPDFQVGLENISTAIVHFNNSKEGVLGALETAQDIISEVFIGEGGELGDVVNIVEEAYIGYDKVILEVAAGSVDFLNATYKTTLAVNELGDVDFKAAHTWMGFAANDLSEANTTLRAIDTSDLSNDSVLPFWGTVEIMSDMTELLTYFAAAATNGTECYIEIEEVLLEMDRIDFAVEAISNINSSLSSLAINVSEAVEIFNAAKNNIGNATELSETFVDKSYGDMMDGSLKPMLVDFSNMLDQFYSNITEIQYLLTGLEKTVVSSSAFTEGFMLFNASYNLALIDAGGPGGNVTDFFANFSANPDVVTSQQLMDFSIGNASEGHAAIGQTTVIADSVTTTWQNLLYHPAPPGEANSSIFADPKSIAGLAAGVNILIAGLVAVESWGNFELAQLLFDAMNEVNFAEVF